MFNIILMKFFFTSFICLFFLSSSCISNKIYQSRARVSNQNVLIEVSNYLIGNYDTEVQSKDDSAYFNIALHMAPIWGADTIGKWLYVEQAMASTPSKPYRQRVYHLIQNNDNEVESFVFTFKTPKRVINWWQNSSNFDSLTVNDIELKKGCSIVLKKQNKQWKGNTNGKDCFSDLRGACYATSVVTLQVDKLISWDQGFDCSEKQVWGATKGGYIFSKK